MEMSETQRRLLVALVDIERRATVQARLGGCRCGGLVPGMDREYPYATFNTVECVGKPFDQIPWKMAHLPGCPMDGQEGVG
jgi:hypothetical protein